MDFRALVLQNQAAGPGSVSVTPRVLILAADEKLRYALLLQMRRHRFHTRVAADTDGAVRHMREWCPTVVIVDPKHLDIGTRIFNRLHDIDPNVQMVAYTEAAAHAIGTMMGAGADRVILKDAPIIAVVDAANEAHNQYHKRSSGGLR